MPRKRKPKSANSEVNALWPIMQAMAGLPDERSADYPAALKRVMAAKTRMDDARQQMERREGPLYELAAQRGRVISGAYRAMGSPPKPPFSEFRISETGALIRDETPEWQRWRTWLQEKTRLQRELGMQRWKPRDVSE